MISDTHEKHEDVIVPDGDVLIHAGDFSMMGEPKRIYNFAEWFTALPHKHKILIAGNHDLSLDPEHAGSNNGIVTAILQVALEEMGIIYLNEDSATIDGRTFYGSPYTRSYGNWAFMEPEYKLAKRYEKMPKVDVLITHGPPLGFLDPSYNRQLKCMENVGERALRDRVLELKPKIHVFGHIHSGYGKFEYEGIKFFNAAVCNERYVVTNKPWEVEI